LSESLRIRPATAEDIPLILQFIRDLAEYERSPQSAQATAEDLQRDGFSANPKFRVVIAEWDLQPAGFALFFYNYSTWQGKPGLFLEDLFVRPEFRERGIGKALLMHLANIAVNENCGRFVWQVLDWNTPSIEFYKSLGAKVMTEWLTMRVDGEALERLVLAQSPKLKDER
jgi:GNAT superfamily N-acetyltransferase